LGERSIPRDKKLSLKVPAGVDSGVRLRVGGEGELGTNGGPPGDLFVFMTVAEHPRFLRDGNNILCDVLIPFTKAILGGSVSTPTIKGEIEIKIPAGTQNGKMFRLKGVGFPSLKGHQLGDQLVKINVEIPTKLTARQKSLLEEYAAISDPQTEESDPNPFFEKVKNLFP
jgi:molecular chaperone DnaJ